MAFKTFSLVFMLWGHYDGNVGDNKVAIPLLNDLKAPLVANLDVIKINEVIPNYVNAEVERKIKDLVKSEIDILVNAKTSELTKLFDARVNSAAMKITNSVDIALTTVMEDTQKELKNVSTIIQQIHGKLQNTSSEVGQLLFDTNNKVGFTACRGRLVSNNIVHFSEIETSYGHSINSTYRNGVFVPFMKGFYLITVNVLGKGSNGAYISRNGDRLSRGWFNFPKQSHYNTGATSTFVKLETTDRVSVKLWKHGSIDAASCLTIMKI